MLGVDITKEVLMSIPVMIIIIGILHIYRKSRGYYDDELD
jgi:hypothetical protein